MPRDEIVTLLREAHVPAAAVRTVDEAVRDERQHARRSLQWVEDPDLGTVPLAYSPIRFHESPIFELDPPPTLGRDTDVILTELLDLSPQEISTLRSTGTIV